MFWTFSFPMPTLRLSSKCTHHRLVRLLPFQLSIRSRANLKTDIILSISIIPIVLKVSFSELSWPVRYDLNHSTCMCYTPRQRSIGAIIKHLLKLLILTLKINAYELELMFKQSVLLYTVIKTRYFGYYTYSDKMYHST
jgi:hypothetical protein